MPNSFLSGFAEGANTGLRLRDYEQNRERQALRDRMAQESHDTRQRAANLQYDVAQQQLADQRGLRDLNQLEYSLQTGVPIPQAQRAYERMFGHYGQNVDQAEADVAELERAAASGEAGEQTRQAINRGNSGCLADTGWRYVRAGNDAPGRQQVPGSDDYAKP